ncbi:hypothetical protein AN416_02525 [Paraburkholderia caribensis]|nr:hypothetical protein AN416_02525 [Paraburkholderia caribensis]
MSTGKHGTTADSGGNIYAEMRNFVQVVARLKNFRVTNAYQKSSRSRKNLCFGIFAIVTRQSQSMMPSHF